MAVHMYDASDKMEYYFYRRMREISVVCYKMHMLRYFGTG